MKHFKLFPVLVLMMLIMVLQSCSNVTSPSIEYEALQVGVSDGVDDGVHQSEFPLWDSSLRNYHQDDSAPRTATVTFLGNTYTGEYDRSVVWAPTLFKTHVYVGDGFRFDVNGSTGELTSIRIYNPDETAYVYDQSACRKIADRTVSECVDVENFEIEENVNKDSYSFHYVRKMNGYETTDRVSITVEKSGVVSYFGYTTLHDFKDVDAHINAAQAERVLYEKLDTIYSQDSKRTESEIYSVELVKMEDGSIAFYYTVKNEFLDGNHQYGSMISILVKAK